MSATKRLLALPLRLKFELLWLLALIAFIESGLRLIGLNRVAKILGVHLGFDNSTSTSAYDLSLSNRERERLELGLRMLRRGPFNGTCLRRALLAGYILRSHAHAVRVGVRSVDGNIAAHAWLVVDGVSLDPDADEQFARLTVPETIR